MQKINHIPYIAMILLSFAFLCASAIAFLRGQQSNQQLANGKILDTDPVSVIGPHTDFAGDPRSSYTLVEFGDYQCPPCRAVNNKLPSILKQYKGKLRFVFRNLPLVELHHYALSAAIAAEAGRQQKKFWPTHDLLFQLNLDNNLEDNVISKEHLNRHRFIYDSQTDAKVAVQSDITEAKTLHLDSTPTFILCCPDMKVIYLGSVKELNKYIR